MPELPEVETIARQLQVVLPGKIIESVDVLRDKSFKGTPQILVGLKIKQVGRKQKTIIIELVASEILLLVHLKMTGQLIFDQKHEIINSTFEIPAGRLVGGHPTLDWIGSLPSNHTRVIIHFTDGSTLFFNDMRVFGWVKIVTRDWWLEMSDKLPPDVIDLGFTVEYLQQVLSKSNRAIKLVILDQDKMGGMGNIYANDALWLAKIDPRKPANKLSEEAVKELHKAMVQVLLRGIEVGGASESTYKHINGMGGKYQEEFLIYKKQGEKCGRCGGVIEKFKLGGRGTYWCSGCQV